MARASVLAIVLSLLGCRAEPARYALSWAKELDVVDLGDGQCVIVDDGSVQCEKPMLADPANKLGFSFSTVRSGDPSSRTHCGLTKDGRVACWGVRRSYSTLRVGLSDLDAPHASAIVLRLADVVQIDVASTHACALQKEGGVRCWEFDPHRMRIPETYERLPFPPAKRLAMTRAGQACVVAESGEVFCHRGFGAIDKLDAPKARDITAGERHFCTLGLDGGVTCWGQNTYGQTGAPTEPCAQEIRTASFTTACMVEPARVKLDRPAAAVVAGQQHSCALLEGGDVACWGKNNDGALGFAPKQRCYRNLPSFCDPVPGLVAGVSDVVQLVASKSGARTWALRDDGTVVAWPQLKGGGKDPRFGP